MRKFVAALGIAMCAGLTFVIIACTPVPNNSISTSAVASPGAPGTGGPAARPASIGSTISIKGLEDGNRIDVMAVKIVSDAAGSDDMSTPKAGYRYVAVQFRIHNTGAKAYSDSPSNGAKVLDTQGQTYDSTIADTTAGQNFSASTNIAPGDSALGFIVFEVPVNATIAKVQFGTDSGFGNVAQWLAN